MYTENYIRLLVFTRASLPYTTFRLGTATETSRYDSIL